MSSASGNDPAEVLRDLVRRYSGANAAVHTATTCGAAFDAAEGWFRFANRSCGDTVYLRIGHDQTVDGRAVVADIVAEGCALCRASAAVAQSVCCGRTLHVAAESARAVVELLGHGASAEDASALTAQFGRLDPALHAELPALVAVTAFPARARCISLPWEALLDCAAARGG